MNIAFISNAALQCGVAQFGNDIVEALQDFSKHQIRSYKLASKDDFDSAYDDISAADIILYNYHPLTIGFIKKNSIKLTNRPSIGLLHEFNYLTAYSELADLFNYRIVSDPSFFSRMPGLWSVPRIISQTPVSKYKNNIFTIGTFGFATSNKNFDDIVKFAASNFANVRLRLHIPNSYYCDRDGKLADEVLLKCRNISGHVDIEFSNEFLSKEDLILYLSKNDLNVFLYDNDSGRGISSVSDFALASESPFALSSSGMFRHMRVFAPELFLDTSPLEYILENGQQICRRLKALWSPENAARQYDDIFEQVLHDYHKPHITCQNTVLTDDFRDALRPAEDEMQSLSPEVYVNKPVRANVQQAFVFNLVQKYVGPEDSILCIGYNQDTAYFALKQKGYQITGIDPLFNMDLNEFYQKNKGKVFYKCIFSTSVIEHVPDDEAFISHVADLLAPGGVAILTMDFNDQYRKGDPVPGADCRFYTADYLFSRFVPLLKNCRLVDVPDWKDHQPDFEFEGCHYGFATLVFCKNEGIPDEIAKHYETGLQNLLVEENENKLKNELADIEQKNRQTEQRHMEEISAANQIIARQKADIAEREMVISERDMAIAERDVAISQRDRTIAEKNQRILVFENSHSWRFTRPLRFLRLCLRNPHEALRKLKTWVKARPWGWKLARPYRCLRLLKNDPAEFCRKAVRKVRKMVVREHMPPQSPKGHPESMQNIEKQLRTAMNDRVYGNRLKEKE